MPKQLNVNLAFTADIKPAQAQLKELQSTLQEIAKLPGKASSLFDDTEIKNASKAALELQQHLSAAVNVKTGNLDLSRLSSSLKSAGKDLNTYYQQLVKIGPQGQEAFLQLAKSISLAEAPVTRVNAKLAEMGTTLKNAARWQISSSILHGLMGTLQGAYGYAQDLNESLNNIRIVTGQSVDEMSDFAKEANNAAKSLSTTTTAYSNAALIFYQQGLTGEDVTSRTDTVIKMANVTKDSAEDVSSYMTAIWSNYADGSTNLEHYADVITALGAATASSSAEIAAGLEKFASIGQTVGLSYEYATAALATVVATTRQSEGVVGTAFKTIFSRLQGLSLGDTLEDGVDLNKYSKALDAVGVAVLDTTGNMRKLDDILDDLAGKWSTLSNAQQTALAQTVAGTRQYTQLIALMNNWDFMQKNVEVAKDSEGSLQEQAEIYAESWDAASARVKAALQGIYQNLLDDNFFISMANAVEKLAESVQGLIEGLGGMKGVVSVIGSVFLSLYAKKMPEALDNLKQNFMVFSGQANKLMIETQQKTAQHLSELQNDSQLSLSFKIQAEGIERVNEMQQKLIINSKNMTEADQNNYKAKIQNVQAIYQEVAALAKEAEELNKVAQANEKRLATNTINNVTGTYAAFNKTVDDIDIVAQKRDSAIKSNDADAYVAAENALEKLKQKELELQIETDKLNELFGFTEEEIEEIVLENGKLSAENIEKIKNKVNEATEAYKDQIIARKLLNSLSENMSGQSKEWQKQAIEIGNDSAKVNELKTNMKAYLDIVKQMAGDSKNGFDIQINELEVLETALDKTELNAKECAEAFENFQTAINTVSGDNTLNSRIDTIDNKIRELEATLSAMGAGDGMRQLEIDAEAAAESMNKFRDSSINARGAASKLPQSATEASVAFSQFASSAMMTYSAINSLKSTLSTMKDALEGNASAFEVIGVLISFLTTATMAYGSASKTLKDLKVVETIQNKLLAASEAGVTKSKIAATAATWGLEAATAALVATVAAAIVVVVAIVKVIDYFHTSAKEAAKAVEESAKNYKAATNELDNLNSELETANNRIAELKDKLKKGTITIVEREELTKLQAANVQLEAQIKNQERLAQIERKKLASSMKTSWEKGNYNIDEGEDNQFISGMNYTVQQQWNTEAENPFNNFDVEDFSQWDAIEVEYNKLIRESNDAESEYWQHNKENFVENRENFVKELDEKYQSIMENWSDVIQHPEDFDEKMVADFKATILKWYQVNDQLDSTLATMADDLDLTKAELDRIGNGESIEKVLSKDKLDQVHQYLDVLGLDLNDIDDNLANLASKGYLDYIFEGINEREADIVKLKESLEQIPKVLSTLYKGDEITDKDQSLYLQDLEQKYVELGAIQDRTSKHYIEMLEAVQQAEEKAYSEEILKKYNEQQIEVNKHLKEYANIGKEVYDERGFKTNREKTKEEIEVEVVSNLEEVKDELIELTDTKYELELSLTNDIITDVDNIISKAELAATAVSKIGDGFKLAAEDSVELFKVFPELAENAQVLADGIIQLDGEVVQQVLGSNGAIIDSDTNVTKNRIENRITELEADRDAAREKLDILLNYADDETKVDAVLAELAEENATNESIMSENVAKDEVINSAASAESIISNWAAKEKAATLYAATAKEAEAEGHETSGNRVNAAKNLIVKAPGKTSNTATEGTETKSREQARQEVIDAAVMAQEKRIQSDTEQIAQLVAAAAKLNAGSKKIDTAAKNTGSSKDKKKETKDAKDYDDEFDRFKPYRDNIEAISDELEKLSKQQEHLFGNALVESLAKSNKKLKEQKQAYKDLRKEQKAYKKELQGKLLNFGAQFKDNGQLSNYKDMTGRALNEYNDAVDRYNKSAQTDADKAILQNAESKFNLFKSLLSEYDKILEDIKDTDEKIEDTVSKTISNRYKAWKTTIELDLDLRKAERSWEDFVDRAGKNFRSIYKDFDVEMAEATKRYDRATEDIERDIANINDVKKEIKKHQKANAKGKEYTGGKFETETAALEELRNLEAQLLEDSNNAQDAWEALWKTYINSIDQVFTKWDKLVGKFDNINDSLDHQAKVIELLYGDTDYARSLSTLVDKTKATNDLGKMETLKAETAALKAQIANAGEEVTDEDIAKIRDQIEKNEKEMESTIEHYLSTIQSIFEKAVKDAMRNFEKALTNGSTINKVQEQWEDAMYAAEGYYDDVERIYQLESLESKWESAIQKNSNIKNQQKLKGLMDAQLEGLREKTELTEYDVELAEKQLAIYEAQIALEDAQNNKNSMKLTRDESGNWSYQYVLDPNEVDDKKQNFLDKQNDYYEFTKNSWQDLTEEIWKDVAVAQERITTLLEEYNTADTARREEIGKELDYLYDYYYGETGVITKKVGKNAEYQNNLNIATMTTLWGLYETDKNNYELMTEAEKGLINGVKDAGVTSYLDLANKVAKDDDSVYNVIKNKATEVNSESLASWDTTAANIISKWNGEDESSVRNQLTSAYDAVKAAVGEFDEAVSNGSEASGQNIGDVTGAVEDLNKAIIANKNEIPELVAETNKLSQYKAWIDSLGKSWDEVKKKAEAAMEYAIKATNKLKTIKDPDIKEKKDKNETTATPLTPKPAATAPSSGSTPASGSTAKPAATNQGNSSPADTMWSVKNQKKQKVEKTGTYAECSSYINSKKYTVVNTDSIKKIILVTYTYTSDGIAQITQNGSAYNVKSSSGYSKPIVANSKNAAITKADQEQSFDTGGYTGEWEGGNGKLAFLHSKELVLNKDDTENILDAVQILRQFATKDLAQLVGDAISHGLSSLIGKALNFGSNNYDTTQVNNNTNEEQNVTINVEAVFPYANDINEIREAILSLPNYASQFKMRK